MSLINSVLLFNMPCGSDGCPACFIFFIIFVIMMVMCMLFCFFRKKRSPWMWCNDWQSEQKSSASNAKEILKSRLAKGEISEEEYEKLLKRLNS